MSWLAKLFVRTPTQANDTHNNHDCCDSCDTKELNDFIQKFVTAESLEPAVAAFTSQSDCGCGCDDAVEITILDSSGELVRKRFVAKLEVLLAGHNAWCVELEQMMRQNKTSEFDLNAVGEGLMCCIGKWLQCESVGLHDYPEYLELVEIYQSLQKCAGTMLDNHKQGNLIDAVYLLRGEFAQLSDLVKQSLLNLVSAILNTIQNDNVEMAF